MEVEHEHLDFDRQTALERRYLPYIHSVKDLYQRAHIVNELTGKSKEYSAEDVKTFGEQIAPHQGFIDAYNVRAIDEQKKAIKKKSQKLYNEKGERYGRLFDQDGFRNIHDPISIFQKKANYEDLAWKVFTEVDDSNIYMKTLYYPNLTSNDMHNLLDSFEEEYKTLCNRSRFAYVAAFGSLIGTWALAYNYRFKFTSFLAATSFVYVACKWTLDQFSASRMSKNLNTIASIVAVKYPEIKFSRVEYTKSSEIKNQKLI